MPAFAVDLAAAFVVTFALVIGLIKKWIMWRYNNWMYTSLFEWNRYYHTVHTTWHLEFIVDLAEDLPIAPRK